MTAAPSSGSPRVRVGAVLAVAVLAGVVAWLVFGGGDDKAKPGATTQAASGAGVAKATATTPAKLALLARSLGHPVYWAGAPRGGAHLELSETPDRKVYVRYLPAGVKIGAKAGQLTIATYPVPAALASLRRAAGSPGGKTSALPGGGLVLSNADRPTNVYVAYPRTDLQIEVYDPANGRALQLVRGGRLAPVTAR